MFKRSVSTLALLTSVGFSTSAFATNLSTWTAPTLGGTTISPSALSTERGTMIAAVLVLRNTTTNQQSIMQFNAAQLASAGHLSLADDAYGPSTIVELVAFTMAYPGGLIKQVTQPVAALPSSKRPLSLVYAASQMTAQQQQALGTGPNWQSNNAITVIMTDSMTGPVLYSSGCNYFLHSLKDGSM